MNARRPPRPLRAPRVYRNVFAVPTQIAQPRHLPAHPLEKTRFTPTPTQAPCPPPAATRTLTTLSVGHADAPPSARTPRAPCPWVSRPPFAPASSPLRTLPVPASSLSRRAHQSLDYTMPAEVYFGTRANRERRIVAC
jgi:hypothetical protein